MDLSWAYTNYNIPAMSIMSNLPITPYKIYTMATKLYKENYIASQETPPVLEASNLVNLPKKQNRSSMDVSFVLKTLHRNNVCNYNTHMQEIKT